MRRFTPYHHEAALVADPKGLALSPGARTLLGFLLWRAGRLGQGGGCRPSEGMYVRRIASAQRGDQTLMADTGMTKWRVRESLRELGPTGLGIVRSVLVRPLERLPAFPNGASAGRAEGTVMVFYVHLFRLRELLGLGTNVAKKSVPQTSWSLCGSAATPQKPAQNGGPSVKTSTEISCDHLWLTTNVKTTEPQGIPAIPPSGGGGEFEISEDELDALVALWWRLGGRTRSGQTEAPAPRVVRSLKRAMRTALAEEVLYEGKPLRLTTDDLRAVIRARFDRRIGGKAHDFCERPTRHPDHPIWQEGIFGGALTHLLVEARLFDSRQRASQKAAPTVDLPEPHRPEPADARTRLEGAQEVRADLQKLLGVDPDPAWLKERQSPTWQDERAAFRFPRRR